MTDDRPTTGIVLGDAPPSTAVERDLACVVCEYPLRGLERSSVCPECGAPILRSLHGDRLRNADPAYLCKLRIGLRFVLAPFVVVIASFVLAIAGTFVGLLLPGGSGQPVLKGLWWIVTIAVLASAIGWPIGWYLFSSHEPGLDRPVWQRRYLVRAGSVIMCSAFLALFFAPFVQGVAMPVFDGLTVLFFIGGVICYYPSLLLLFAVIARTPGYHHFGNGWRAMLWLGPLLPAITYSHEQSVLAVPEVIGLAAFFGMLGWGVMYLGLLDRARRAVAAEYALAASHHARTDGDP